MSDSTPTDAPLTVLVYSDDRAVRAEVRRILGRKVAADLPEIEVVECATQPAVIAAFDGGNVDLGILDGEAVPSGGMGLCRQLKDEIAHCPPVMLLLAREQDAWLGAWSRAEGAVSYPLDPVRLPTVAADLLRNPRGGTDLVAAGNAAEASPRTAP